MEEKAKKEEPSKRRWRWPAIVVGGLLALILLILTVVSLVLTPQRLTGWVRQYGTDYLSKGRVEVARVDLSIWSTFPHAAITIDSLAVINERPEVPDTVVAFERFHGRINLAALFVGKISLKKVEIVRPVVTFWQGRDSLTSLSVLPSSDEPKAEEKTEGLSLPDISLESFVIEGDARLRYVSVPDSIDATVIISRSAISGRNDVPQYALNIEGNLGAVPFLRENLAYGIDGGIGWKPDEPLALSLHDFKIELDQLKTQTSMKADFANDVRLDKLSFEVKPLPLQRLCEIAAQVPQLAGVVPDVKTTSTFALKAELKQPYTYVASAAEPPVPEMEIQAWLNDAPISIPSYYVDFSNLGAELAVSLSNRGLASSSVELKRLNVSFPGSDFKLRGSATNLGGDMRADGCFRGRVDFNGLDRRVWTLVGMRLWGTLDADVDFNLRMSDLTPNTFHRAKLKGEASLRKFHAVLPSDSLYAGLTIARLKFGSDEQFGKRDGQMVDSMLMASVKVDSLWVMMPELTARMADLKLGAGVENRAASTDTTTVTPMGAAVSLRTLRYEGVADSTRALLRNLYGHLALTRYKGQGKQPKIGARIGAKRIVFASGNNFVALRGGEISASAFKSPRKKRRRLSPADSVRVSARRDSMLLAQSQYERVEIDVDRNLITLLRRWHISGSLKADGGRLITPMWPLKTRMRNLRFDFNADSLNLRSMDLTTGQSDFSLSGTINNIQRSLGRRHLAQPLRLRLDLKSDTINVNQLVQTAFRGAAAEPAISATPLELDVADAVLEQQAEVAESDTMMAVVVPMNIDAELNFRAGNIIYSNMALRDFAGQVLIANGAANLNELRASTDIGSAELNMLYCAPKRSDVDFGMSLDLHRFNLGRVTELIPALDSVMPMLRSFGGVVDAQVSATTEVDSMLNINFPSLKAMVRLKGDSLVVLDPETFKTISRWLLFKNKNKNMIDHMDVQLAVEDNMLNIYPFMFDFDRYRLGVMGHNDLNLNLNYHISVLKSPIPFKFGINVKGTMEKMKIRLGRAKFKENMVAESVALGDTIRMNLAREMRSVFRRGTRAARLAPLHLSKPGPMPELDAATDTLAPTDSIFFIQQGLIEAPDSLKQQ